MEDRCVFTVNASADGREKLMVRDARCGRFRRGLGAALRGKLGILVTLGEERHAWLLLAM